MYTYIYLYIPTYTSTYLHIPLHTYIYLYIPTYTSTYLHIPLHTYIYICTVSTLLLVYVDDGAKLQGRLNYTAGNGLIQVSFFLGLMQVCRQVESSLLAASS